MSPEGILSGFTIQKEGVAALALRHMVDKKM